MVLTEAPGHAGMAEIQILTGMPVPRRYFLSLPSEEF